MGQLVCRINGAMNGKGVKKLRCSVRTLVALANDGCSSLCRWNVTIKSREKHKTLCQPPQRATSRGSRLPIPWDPGVRSRPWITLLSATPAERLQCASPATQNTLLRCFRTSVMMLTRLLGRQQCKGAGRGEVQGPSHRWRRRGCLSHLDNLDGRDQFSIVGKFLQLQLVEHRPNAEPQQKIEGKGAWRLKKVTKK